MMRAVAYCRVSTGKQDRHGLSLPEQLAQISAYCQKSGWALVHVYKDARSAKEARRPGFKAMMADAAAFPRPFDVVVVYAQSRFFRHATGFGIHEAHLKSLGVRLVALNLQTDDSPSGRLVRTIISACDQFESENNGDRVRDMMLANAKAGFWNGSLAPYGYESVTVEVRDGKHKKRLAVRDEEARIVKKIYSLYLNGIDGEALGIRKLINVLHDFGERTSGGRLFTASFVHNTLTNRCYTGEYIFNRMDRTTGEVRPEEEWIRIAIPQIISQTDFEAVQRKLNNSRHEITAPRNINSPTLLTTLLRCPECGAGHQLATGKSGRYRYYDCGEKLRKGVRACSGFRIKEADADASITRHFVETVFSDRRLAPICQEIRKRLVKVGQGSDAELRALRAEISDVRGRIHNLLSAIEVGSLNHRRVSVRSKLADLEKRLGHLQKKEREFSRISDRMPGRGLSSKVLSHALSEAFSGAPTHVKRRYIAMLVERITVSAPSLEVRWKSARCAPPLRGGDDG